MDAIRLTPLIKYALWRGTRLEKMLGKATGGISGAAKGWEVWRIRADAGEDQVQAGRSTGRSAGFLGRQA